MVAFFVWPVVSILGEGLAATATGTSPGRGGGAGRSGLRHVAWCSRGLGSVRIASRSVGALSVIVRARTALLVLVALLGLGGACAVGASPVLAAATGGPDPDPPPPAPPAPVPPPPPAPVPPPPPPPAYVPPPPPALAVSPRSKPKPKVHHAKPKAEKKASLSAGSSTRLPRSPDKPLVASAAAVPAAAATVTATSPHFVLLLLGVLLVTGDLRRPRGHAAVVAPAAGISRHLRAPGGRHHRRHDHCDQHRHRARRRPPRLISVTASSSRLSRPWLSACRWRAPTRPRRRSSRAPRRRPRTATRPPWSAQRRR